MSKVTVHPIRDEEIRAAEYDVAVAACGFESRSRFYFETSGVRATRNLVTDYGHRHGVAYKDNRKWFDKAAFELECEDDKSFAARFQHVIGEAVLDRERVRVVVDISSFTRVRLATLIESLWHQTEYDFEIDWVYSLAEFYPPPDDIPIDHVGPVAPLFAGWTDTPELPTTAVFGLGFEPGKVLGAVEYLESGDVFACIPDGPDPRFRKAVLESNSTLLGELGADHLVNYRVGNPFDTFVWVEGMSAGLLRRSRLVLIPFGPKIFALNCMLAALVHFPRVMVLRVSGFGSNDHDVEAAGPTHQIRCRIQR